MKVFGQKNYLQEDFITWGFCPSPGLLGFFHGFHI